MLCVSLLILIELLSVSSAANQFVVVLIYRFYIPTYVHIRVYVYTHKTLTRCLGTLRGCCSGAACVCAASAHFFIHIYVRAKCAHENFHPPMIHCIWTAAAYLDSPTRAKKTRILITIAPAFFIVIVSTSSSSRNPFVDRNRGRPEIYYG